MKKHYISYFLVGLILTLLVPFSGCYSVREQAYYGDRDNFITEEAIVDNIIYNEEKHYIVLWLSEIDPSYQACEFILRGDNVTLALENDILNNIKVGDRITYTSAPGFFGNGYFMPIVGLSIKGKEILNLEKGYQNLMDFY